MSLDSHRSSRPPSAMRWLAGVCALVLAVDLLDLAGVLYHKHGHYGAEEWFGCYALAGIAAGAAAIAAGWLGRGLRSREGTDHA